MKRIPLIARRALTHEGRTIAPGDTFRAKALKAITLVKRGFAARVSVTQLPTAPNVPAAPPVVEAPPAPAIAIDELHAHPTTALSDALEAAVAPPPAAEEPVEEPLEEPVEIDTADTDRDPTPRPKRRRRRKAAEEGSPSCD